MKYIVELKYTNPSHEHVSLRRRVESRSTIIEASSEEEAILRASRQQRALGFTVREANVVKPEVIKEEVESVDEAKGEPPPEFMPSDTKLPRIKVPAKPKPGVRKRGPVGSFNKKGFWNPGVRYEEVEQVEEAKVSTVGASKESDTELANYLKKKLKKAQSNQAKGTAGYPLLKKGEKLKPMKMKEEVELDEAKADPKLALKAMDLRHGVDTDKRVAGYKMSDPVRKAQAKFDAQARAQQVKKVQAGTLAAQRQRELAKKTDEATDPGKTRVVNKKVKTEKAAETMITKAKGMRNQINMKPELNSDGQKKV